MHMKVKMILPALAEAESPFWRPIKYSLFPPLGLATLAAYLSEDDEIELLDLMINGSFVFGLDDDDTDVFKRTVEWGVSNALTTSTYHILTPYPGTKLYADMLRQNRIVTQNWDLYDTRHVVYRTKKLSPAALKSGYDWAYREFYSWNNIIRAAWQHTSHKHKLKHFLYTGGWKKFEPLWNFIIKTRGLNRMLPLLEAILSEVKNSTEKRTIPENAPLPITETTAGIPDSPC